MTCQNSNRNLCKPSDLKCSKCAVRNLPVRAAAVNCPLYLEKNEEPLSLVRVKLEVAVIRQKLYVNAEPDDLHTERELGCGL